ncbi:MAG: cytochrome C oxidase subunit IV family protein [Actinobacteria bacterium]|nr:cytochrome C oxidase subunit IV family protein [Actinomycetota bacterium]
MATEVTHTPAEQHVAAHPTPRDYVNIAIVLAIITAAEVMTYFFRLPGWALWGGLTGMAIAKFTLVVGFYMHLRYDSRMFRRVFLFGLILATTVFLLVLGVFAVGPEGGGAGN